jgi:3'-phosphoadenosine 5'-phosphosulfate sulfotransferase (PAPS reductase)/FAD synthetase
LDNEFILIDRVDSIKKVINKYGIENFVISFSGGKDSTVLSKLIDIAIPNNDIPRVFINTGIEYKAIVDFVHENMKKDKRFIEIKPSIPLSMIFRKYGYPFKSKEHSQLVHLFQQNGHSKTTLRYYNPPENRKRFGCPKVLKYQFEEGTQLKISDKCCTKLKKEPFTKWQEENRKPYKMTGERLSEGGLRASHKGCLVIDKNSKLKKFKPLNPVTSEWLEWFINEYKVQLCKLYDEPYNFKRTGCLGYPFNINLQDTLDTLEKTLPLEKKKAEAIWKEVYQEYRKLNYRLKR